MHTNSFSAMSEESSSWIFFFFRFDYSYFLNTTMFSLLILCPLPFGGSLTLYTSLQAILALHLLIVQSTIWVLVLLDTFSNPLWVVAAKATLFRGLLHINPVRRFGRMHWMWEQPQSFQSCQGYPPLQNIFSIARPPLAMCH